MTVGETRRYHNPRPSVIQTDSLSLSFFFSLFECNFFHTHALSFFLDILTLPSLSLAYIHIYTLTLCLSQLYRHVHIVSLSLNMYSLRSTKVILMMFIHTYFQCTLDDYKSSCNTGYSLNIKPYTLALTARVNQRQSKDTLGSPSITKDSSHLYQWENNCSGDQYLALTRLSGHIC